MGDQDHQVKLVISISSVHTEFPEETQQEIIYFKKIMILG